MKRWHNLRETKNTFPLVVPLIIIWSKIDMNYKEEFKIHKQNIYCRLVGQDKYYNARQCYMFAKWVKKNGWGKINPDQIKKIFFYGEKIILQKYDTCTITIKYFNTAKEMFSFVDGFNMCIHGIVQIADDEVSADAYKYYNG
jgi:hypothetical protein